MSEIPARQAFAVSATDTDIYLLCPDAVECYGYDGVQNWVQTGLPSRPLAVLHGKQTLVFTGSQADVLAKQPSSSEAFPRGGRWPRSRMSCLAAITNLRAIMARFASSVSERGR